MNKHRIPEVEYARFKHWANEAGRYGLVMCSSGNLSHRVDDESIIISTTGAWLEKLDESRICHLNLKSGEIINGSDPSGECGMHRAIMVRRPDIDTILHFQGPAATTLACMPQIPDYNVIIEVPVYIGKITHVPFLMPGSRELADAVAAGLKDSNIVQMRNHGQVVCGKGYADTIQKAVFFELACRILLQSNLHAETIPEAGKNQLKHYNNLNK